MIRFVCPKCTAVLNAPDDQAGGVVSCARCGQRMRVPVPAKDGLLAGGSAAAGGKAVAGLSAGDGAQPATPSDVVVVGAAHEPAAASGPASDTEQAHAQLAIARQPEPVVKAACPACGKRIKTGGPVAGKRIKCPRCDQSLTFSADGQQLSATLPSVSVAFSEVARPEVAGHVGRARAVKPYLYAGLAVLLGIAALPLAVHFTSYLLGATVAGAGLVAGGFGFLVALTRRGAGLGLSALGVVVCGTALYVAVQLAGGWVDLLRPFRDQVGHLGGGGAHVATHRPTGPDSRAGRAAVQPVGLRRVE
jgi:hypothetical protein